MGSLQILTWFTFIKRFLLEHIRLCITLLNEYYSLRLYFIIKKSFAFMMAYTFSMRLTYYLAYYYLYLIKAIQLRQQDSSLYEERIL